MHKMRCSTKSKVHSYVEKRCQMLSYQASQAKARGVEVGTEWNGRLSSFVFYIRPDSPSPHWVWTPMPAACSSASLAPLFSTGCEARGKLDFRGCSCRCARRVNGGGSKKSYCYHARERLKDTDKVTYRDKGYFKYSVRETILIMI